MPIGTKAKWHFGDHPGRPPDGAGTDTFAVASSVVLRRLVPILAVTVALAGCGDESTDPSASSSSTSVTTAPAPVETTTSTAPTTTTQTTTTGAQLTDESRLGFEGIGPIEIGMTLDEATAAVGKPVKVNPNYILDNCAFAAVDGGPEKLSFMVGREKEADPWRIFRADVNEGSPIATISGIRVGDSEARVEETYSGKGGTYTVEPHPYTGPKGHYLIYDVDGEGGKLLIFETDGAKVTSFRAGEDGAVRAIEGCA
jgi:hypothetical protein